MIVLDYSGIAIASILGYDSKLEGSLEENKNLVRHVILSKIREYKRQFSKDFGNEIVIACDGGDYWRKQIFPHYKASRKKNRDNSDIPWDMVYQCMDDVRNVLQNFFPYKVIQVPHAEADDVMFVMSDIVCKERGTVVGIEEEVIPEKCLVISSDKDLKQLVSKTTRLYSPYTQTYAAFESGENAKSFLRKLILTGDSGDGIPNGFSPASTLVDGIRQKAATEKKMAPILESKDLVSGTDDIEVKKRIMENARLISFKFVPNEIINAVIESYNEPIEGSRMAAYEWMASNNMKLLMNDIEAF